MGICLPFLKLTSKQAKQYPALSRVVWRMSKPGQGLKL